MSSGFCKSLVPATNTCICKTLWCVVDRLYLHALGQIDNIFSILADLQNDKSHVNARQIDHISMSSRGLFQMKFFYCSPCKAAGLKPCQFNSDSSKKNHVRKVCPKRRKVLIAIMQTHDILSKMPNAMYLLHCTVLYLESLFWQSLKSTPRRYCINSIQ